MAYMPEQIEAIADRWETLTPEEQAAEYAHVQKVIAERKAKRLTMGDVGIMMGSFFAAPLLFPAAGAAAAAAPVAAAPVAAAPAAAAAAGAGLTAVEIAALATAGFGIYKGITDQQRQEEALEMQEEYLAKKSEAEKASALTEAGSIYATQPQNGPAQPIIYQTPAAKQAQNYIPLVIVAIAAFLLLKKGKIK